MKIGLGLGLSAIKAGGGGGAPATFGFTLVNEQGSAVIVAADMPELFVSINGAAYQTLVAAGLTLTMTGGKPVITGFANPAHSRRYTYEPGTTEPYWQADTVATADTTGTTIKTLWARNVSTVRPALGAVTANFCPGLAIVATQPGTSVLAA